MRIKGVETHFQSPYRNQVRTSAVDFHRIISPLTHLKKQTGWDIEITKGLGISRKDTSAQLDALWNKIGKSTDIIYSSYITNPLFYSYLAVASERYNFRYVFDFDDNLLTIKPYNPTYQEFYGDSIKLENFKRIIKDFPYLTVTNVFLKKAYKIFRDKPKKQEYIRILPNFMDFDIYKETEPVEDDVITIGWSGGITHVGDLLHNEFTSAMTYMLGKYGNKIRFEINGFLQGSYFEDYPNVKYVSGTNDFLEWVNYWNKTNHWDIAVAPLENIDFNKTKSALKCLQYGIHNLPVVASDIGPYHGFIKDGKTGYLAKGTKDWLNALDLLITDKIKRKEVGHNLAKDIRDNWDIERNVWRYKEMFEEMLDKRK